MNNMIQDVLHSLRLLRKDLGFTFVAVMALALGIGANSSIFCSIHAMLVAPLPFPQLDRIAVLWLTLPQQETTRNAISPADFLDWRAQTKAFEKLAAYRSITLNLTGVDDPEHLRAYAVSRDYFPLLGVQPQLGRLLTEA